MAGFVDTFLTPIAGGLGGAIGYAIVLRRKPESAPKSIPVWVACVGVGGAVAAILLVFKLL